MLSAKAAIREAEGPRLTPRLGPRLHPRLVEAKTEKNRLHVDIHADHGGREATVARLQEHGATLVRHVKEPGGEWSVLTDPEGNEFCVA